MIVKLGNWLFHFRNFLFPLFYLALFIPTSRVFWDDKIAITLGVILIIIGILIRCITIGLVYIVRGGKNRQIYANGLVTEGIYSICRNPMYLGNIILLLGFGFFANSTLFVYAFFPLFIIFYLSIIRAEEEFLLAKFGDSFTSYKNHVNALIPNIFLIDKAFRGHQFNWKKVISKEFNALYVYIVGILLLLLFEKHIEFLVFEIEIIVVTILYFLVKWMKERHLLN